MQKKLLASIFLIVFSQMLKAEDNKIGPAKLSYSAGLMSQYISRGSQLSNGPSLNFGAELSFPNTFYVAFWTAQVDDTYHNGAEQEIDYYIGIRPKFGNFSTQIAYQSYIYPHNNTGDNNPYSSEFVGAVTYNFEKSWLTYKHYWQDQALGREFYKATYGYNFDQFSTAFEYGNKVNQTQQYYSASLTKKIYDINWTLEYIKNDNPTGSGNSQTRDYLSLNLRKSF